MWKLTPRNRCSGAECDSLAVLQNEIEDLISLSSPGWINYSVIGKPSQPRCTVEIYPDGEDFVLRAETPGVKKDDLELIVTGNTLTLKGSAGKKTEPKEGEVSQVQSWKREILLPAEIDTAAITATYEDGVLTARLPRKEEAKPKQIAIK